MPLTNLAARQAKPAEKPRKFFDGKGLFLLVHPNGSKYWRLKYRYAGKEKLMGLGVYPEVSLAEARERRDEARKVLAGGNDPSQERKLQKRQQKTLAANSFEVLAKEWHKQQKERWTESHAERILQSLQKDVFPSLGRRPVAEITAPEVLEVIRAVERRGALDVASRVLQRTGSVFRYAIQTGRAEYNPCSDLKGALKTRRVVHRAALPREELPEFLTKLEAYDGQPLTKLARLILLTFVRSNELRGARWDEFDLDAAQWRVPAERMKMSAPHLVPLSTQAIEVIEEIRPLTGRFDLVFPSQNSPFKCMSENTLLYALYRMGYHKRATVHGFRALASTVLNESGYKPDVIERQLAHIERNKVRAAYHRSEYVQERTDMMQAWADYLDAVKSGAKVIPFASKAVG